MKNSVKFNKKRLVDYIFNNLSDSKNQIINVYKNEDNSFSHTRNGDWLGGCVQSIVIFRTGDENPKSKAEVKRMLEHYLSIID